MADFDKARGITAMEPEQRTGSKGGGAFAPSIRWKEGETKYIIFLTPAARLATLYLHEWIEVGTWPSGKSKYETFIDRRDPCIGEDNDDLTDRLGQTSRKSTLGVAIELEPVTTKVNNRNKVTSLSVKTEHYTRTNEEGQEEDVESPVIGIVTQRRGNFYGYLASFDETLAIEETPFQVARRGGDKETTYDFIHMSGIPVDYSKLFEFLAGVGYARGITVDLLEGDSDQEKAVDLGEKLLMLRLEEMGDGEKYEELVTPITHIDAKFGNPTPAVKKEAGPPFDEMIPPVAESKADRLRKKFQEANV